MDFPIRSVQSYYRIMKSKRSFHNIQEVDLQIDFQNIKPLQENGLFLPENLELKAFHNSSLLKSRLALKNNSTEISRRSSLSRRKTEDAEHEALSKKKDLKRLNNLSYKLQKSQRSVKDKIAIEDLKQIGEISFNNFDQKPQIPIRKNKHGQQTLADSSFEKWRSFSKPQSPDSKFHMKNRLSHEKRTKNSNRNAQVSLRIRKAFPSNLKAFQSTLDLSTMESQKRLPQLPRLLVRKSSITPWDIVEQDLY